MSDSSAYEMSTSPDGSDADSSDSFAGVENPPYHQDLYRDTERDESEDRENIDEWVQHMTSILPQTTVLEPPPNAAFWEEHFTAEQSSAVYKPGVMSILLEFSTLPRIVGTLRQKGWFALMVTFVCLHFQNFTERSKALKAFNQASREQQVEELQQLRSTGN